MAEFVTAGVHEFFRDQLIAARRTQGVLVRDDTEAYLVNLLAEFAASDQVFSRDLDGRLSQEPLALMLKRAVEAPGVERVRHLRRMGDTALYMSGFFSDSLNNRVVDVDYYAAMGGRAYEALAGIADNARASVFQELAEKFLRIVDLFMELSERAALTTNAGLLRLYERYVRTGSTRLRTLLEERGVLVVPSTLVLQ